MTRAYTKRPLGERFAEKVNCNGPIPSHRPELGPCHVWITRLRSDGYGSMAVDGKNQKSNRVAFFLAHGRWPVPCALHHCDNRACVKALPDAHGPAHIYEGTQAQNNRDLAARGRHGKQQRTHCIHGHSLSGDNLYVSGPTAKRPYRRCRICTKVINGRHLTKKRRALTERQLCEQEPPRE